LPKPTLRTFSSLPHVGQQQASGGTGTATISVSSFVFRSSAVARRFFSASIGSLFGGTGGGIFGRRAAHTRSAVDEVMRTGHVGAEFVEYILRHKRKLEPAPSPLRLGKPDLDGIVLPEPDLAVYDKPRMTRDLGRHELPAVHDGHHEVEHDGVHGRLPQPVERSFSMHAGIDSVTRGFEDRRHRLEDVLVVLND
jgi:hypothetical protein